MLDWLLICRAADPDQARRGRLLNWYLLIFTALALVNLGPTLILGIPALSLVIIFLTGLQLGLYILNRQGAVTLVAVSLVALTFSIMHLLAVLSASGMLSVGLAPALFGIPIALAGATLSGRAVLLVVGLAMVDTVWLYEVGISQLNGYRITNAADLQITLLATLTLLLTIGLLAGLSSHQIQTILDDMRRRNVELETANRSLTAQREKEHQLSANIAGLVAQLSAVSARQTSGVTAQARSINQVVSAAAELHAAADQIAAVAQEVSQVADTALHNVEHAQELVFHSREGVQRNRDQVEQLISRMASLEQLTDRITQFVNRIRDLSDETQLLALNATIEAAGAGAVGRRFGVVAAEVQNLSNRSNEIVDQIRLLIGELQQAAQVMLHTTQGSITVANELEALADQARGAQEQVVGAVQRTSELVHLISTATGQQTDATQQVTQTMQDIAEIAQATSQDTLALERATAELLRAATLLSSAHTSNER